MASAKESGSAQGSLTIFSLPRELRDEIWILIISNDMYLLSKRHDHFYMLLTPRESRQPLTIPSLLRVNRSINTELTATFSERPIFSFQSSTTLRLLLEYGSTSWVSPRPNQEPSMPRLVPKIMFQMKHVSISTHGPVCMATWLGDSSIRLGSGGRKQTLHAKSMHYRQWGAMDAGAENLLKFIHKSPMELRSLEIPATLLLNIHVVRQLRKLRGVDLHFSVVPQSTEPLETNLQKLSLRFRETPQMQPMAWLAETADTDILLPIYETTSDTKPVSVASLLCLAIAICREVASREPVPQRPIAVPEAQVDPPLWIDVDESSLTTCSSLPPPTPGWYRYSARDPGVVCLEKSQPPLPRELLKRKMMKRQRQEFGRRCAVYGRFHAARGIRRTSQVDMERAWTVRRMHLRGVIVKNWSSEGCAHDLLPA